MHYSSLRPPVSERGLRVVILTPYFDAHRMLGVEREVVRLANQLHDSGDQVRIVTSDHGWQTGKISAQRPKDLINVIPVTYLHGRLSHSLRGFQASGAPIWMPISRSLVRDADCCIIYNAGWPISLLLARAGSRAWPPIIYRTYWHPPSGRSRLVNRMRNIVVRIVFSRAQLLVSPTESERVTLLALVGNEAQTIVVEPGVDLPVLRDFAKTRREVRDDLECHRKTLLVVQVGAPGVFKGTDVALDTVGELNERGIDARLLLVGQNSGDGWIEKELLRRGQPTWVKHISSASDIEKSQLLAAADVLLMFSRYEAYGFVALEGIAHETRVVAWSDFPSALELARYGVRLVDRDEGVAGVARAIFGSEDRGFMAKKLRTWSDFADEMKSAIRRVALSTRTPDF